MRRVGHKGADLLAPGNTAASFAAALEAGVDMIEFDVLPERLDGTGELYLAHDPDDLSARPDALTLEQGLEHLAGAGYAGLELDVDLKLPGYELRVLNALRRHGVLDRCIVCSTYAASLRVLRAAAPELRLGFSYPALRSDPTTRPGRRYAALALAAGARRVLPAVLARRVRRGDVDAVMIHWRLFSPALLRAIRRAGGEVYVWTVDDPALVARLEELGVDGVITNDPSLFRGGDGGRAAAPTRMS